MNESLVLDDKRNVIGLFKAEMIHRSAAIALQNWVDEGQHESPGQQAPAEERRRSKENQEIPRKRGTRRKAPVTSILLYVIDVPL
jgi:hypothetical protein